MSNYAIWNFFGPISWIFWLAVIALLLARRSPRWSRRFLMVSVGWFAAAGLSPLGLLLMKPLERRFTRPEAAALPSRAFIAVLGGAESLGASRQSRRPEYNSHADRVIAGAELAVALPESQLAIIGGITEPGWPDRDVDLVARTWVRLGIAQDRIVKVGGTTDTCTNGRGVAAATNRPVILVTSAFHMSRSVACFRAAGIEALPYPVDFETPPVASWRDVFRGSMIGNLERTDLALHEYAGLVTYRLSDRTTELWPAARVASVGLSREKRPRATSP